MSLAPLQILAVVVLVFFTPSTAISGWLCYKLGIGKQWGWLALLVIGLLRITGSALRLAVTEDEDTGISRAARYIPGIGTVTLLLAMLELLDRLNRSLSVIGPLLTRFWSTLYWLQLAAFILSIVGPTTGNEEVSQAAACLIAAIFAIEAGLSLFFLSRRKEFSKVDRSIVAVSSSILPFLAVRVIYAVLTNFAPTGTEFEGRKPGVYVQAFMQYLMEFVVVTLYLVAGSVLEKAKRHSSNEKNQMVGEV